MVLNMDFQSENTISFIRPIPLKRIKSITSDESKFFYKLNILIQSTCKFKKVRLFIILRALNEQGKLCWSNPEPDILQNGIFDFDFDIYFISKKKQNEIVQVLETILEIDKIIITEIAHNEFKNLITDFGLKWQGKPIIINQELIEKAILEEEKKRLLLDKIPQINTPKIMFTNRIQGIKEKIFLPNKHFIKLFIYEKLKVIFSCYKDSNCTNYFLYIVKEGVLFVSEGNDNEDFESFEDYYNIQNGNFTNFYDYLEAIKYGIENHAEYLAFKKSEFWNANIGSYKKYLNSKKAGDSLTKEE